MNLELSEHQILAYQRDGVHLQRNFLSASEVDELKQAVLDAVGRMGQATVAGETVGTRAAGKDSNDYYSKVFTQKLNLWRINSVVKSYVMNPELGKMMSKMAGVKRFQVWHDQALIKEPFGNPTAWHLDNPYWSFSSKNSISIWIALEEATLSNGCMWFLPSSQKMARFETPGIGQNMDALFDVYPQMKSIEPVSFPMQPGDCSFHNGLTAHGAGANMTRGRRIAMTCAYMPTGSKFNGVQNILPDHIFNRLKMGDELNNYDWNPEV